MKLPLFLLYASLWGSGTCRLKGTVRDPSDGVMPGASISCIQQETGFRFAHHTDFQGNNAMTLPEGHYKVLAAQAGCRAATACSCRGGVRNASTSDWLPKAYPM
jgi:hypothetical protein